MEPILFPPRSGPAELFDSMFVTVYGSDCINCIKGVAPALNWEYVNTTLLEESAHERN